MPDIFYVCNKRACGDVCPNGMCEHTSDVTHAVNFIHVDGKYTRTGNTVYFEKEPAMTENMPGTDDLVMRVETKEIEMTEEQTEKTEKTTKDTRKHKPLTEEQKADRRFWNFLDIVYKLARMSGLYIEGHIKVRDKRTGKVWE